MPDEVQMKIDGFLKVPDIKGPSKRDGHEDEIEVFGIHFQMKAPFDPNSMSRRGRVALGTIEFIKHYDMSSPYLEKALFENTMMDEVKFSARRTIGGETKDYLVITLKEASVTDYELAPSTGEPDLIEDRVSFAYKLINFNYDGEHEIEMDVHVGK